MGEPATKMLRYQQQFSFFDVDKLGDSVHFVSLASQVEAASRTACLPHRRRSDPDLPDRFLDITDEGIVMGTGPAAFEGVLHGTARMREPGEQ